MTRPVVIDLFAGAGGTSAGFAQAGWAPIGVTLGVQQAQTRGRPPLSPRYPFPWYNYDIAGERFPSTLRDIIKKHKPALIVAGPPCQGHSPLQQRNRDNQYGSEAHKPQDLIAYTRRLLKHTGLPYIIENVPGALNELTTNRIMLCGSSFGLRVRRHRLFEFSSQIPLPLAPLCDHAWQNDDHFTNSDGSKTGIITVVGTSHNGTTLTQDSSRSPTELARVAMGIDWMSARELSQAIPPQYTRFIGAHVLKHMRANNLARRASRGGRRRATRAATHQPRTGKHDG